MLVVHLVVSKHSSSSVPVPLQHPSPSRVLVDVRPLRLDLFALGFGSLAVSRGALESLGAEAQRNVALGIAAHAHGFPHEAPSMALLEDGDDVFAGYGLGEFIWSVDAPANTRS